MHIPDGLLSTPVWVGLDLVAVPAVGFVARRARIDVEHSRAPLLGVLGAFVFAAQMLNFPVGPGTSAHLVGGTLLAATVGPVAAALVMTAVLVVQALLFQDGGVLALGSNVVSMAFVGVAAGWLPYRAASGRWRDAALFAGGVASVLASAAATLLFLVVSGYRLPAAVLAAYGTAIVFGSLAEGAITVAVLRAIRRISPGSVSVPEASKGARVLLVGTVILLLLGVAVASSSPDWFENIVERAGLAHGPGLAAPMPDYQIPGSGNEWIRSAVAALAGAGAVFVAVVALRRLLRART